MKYSYLYLILFVVLASCSKKEEQMKSQDFSFNEYSQKWKLVKMTGSFEGSETTDEEMSWQESYMFKSDGSFLKTELKMEKRFLL